MSSSSGALPRVLVRRSMAFSQVTMWSITSARLLHFPGCMMKLDSSMRDVSLSGSWALHRSLQQSSADNPFARAFSTSTLAEPSQNPRRAVYSSSSSWSVMLRLVAMSLVIVSLRCSVALIASWRCLEYLSASTLTSVAQGRNATLPRGPVNFSGWKCFVWAIVLLFPPLYSLTFSSSAFCSSLIRYR